MSAVTRKSYWRGLIRSLNNTFFFAFWICYHKACSIRCGHPSPWPIQLVITHYIVSLDYLGCFSQLRVAFQYEHLLGFLYYRCGWVLTSTEVASGHRVNGRFKLVTYHILYCCVFRVIITYCGQELANPPTHHHPATLRSMENNPYGICQKSTRKPGSALNIYWVN